MAVADRSLLGMLINPKPPLFARLIRTTFCDLAFAAYDRKAAVACCVGVGPLEGADTAHLVADLVGNDLLQLKLVVDLLSQLPESGSANPKARCA